MKTIDEPKKHIDALWGKQQICETETYRLMHYVLRVDHDDKVLLHNVVTGQLVELDQDEKKVLEDLPQKYNPVMEQLVTEHYLVPEGFDEYKSVQQIRLIHQTKQVRATGTYINHYVILPTTFCNAHCFYCYESDYPRVHMTEETGDRLIDYIAEHREGKTVSLQWFGGEPLVGIQRIDQISQGLKDREIPFTASMISNGYLFDDKIIERAVDLWKLVRVQITLDGTEDTYNRVKAYANVRDNPFQRVLKNIDLLSSKKIQVNIRLNVDFYNKDDMKILIEELGERYSENKYVGIYLNMLFNDEGYEPVSHTHDEIVQLMNIIADYTERLKEIHKFVTDLKPPFLQFSQCMADNPHTVMIQPDGSFCRCEHETIHDKYGSLVDGITDPIKLEKWREAVDHSTLCPECAIYPACYSLRNCMSGNQPCIERIQESNLEKQKERIRTMYVRKMEGTEDERI